MAGAEVGDRKITASNEAIYAELLAIRELLEEVRPLLPHIPAALRLLDNPASRWKERRAVRQSRGREVQEPIGPEVHREAG
jgi:hypothetical protein